VCVSSFFFFQAEDGIRDFHVTGVQTCALPICKPNKVTRRSRSPRNSPANSSVKKACACNTSDANPAGIPTAMAENRKANWPSERSEERRVGKEWRAGRGLDQAKETERQ